MTLVNNASIRPTLYALIDCHPLILTVIFCFPFQSSAQIAYLSHVLSPDLYKVAGALFTHFLKPSTSVDLWKFYLSHVRLVCLIWPSLTRFNKSETDEPTTRLPHATAFVKSTSLPSTALVKTRTVVIYGTTTFNFWRLARSVWSSCSMCNTTQSSCFSAQIHGKNNKKWMLSVRHTTGLSKFLWKT